MLVRYVVTDLWRNPRRTLSAVVGVSLGIGLFCGVLFFVDGLSASMTQRAVAPLSIDMQRIVSARASNVTLSQDVGGSKTLSAGEQTWVDLTVTNRGTQNANEVTVRSVPDGPAVRGRIGGDRWPTDHRLRRHAPGVGSRQYRVQPRNAGAQEPPT